MTGRPDAPLEGVHVVVTRARAQASTLVSKLLSVGAEPIEAATIEIVDPPDGGRALSAAVHNLDSYRWVVLTSTNAVERYLAAARGRVSQVRHAVVGSATLEALESASVRVDLVPPRFVGASLVEAFETSDDHSDDDNRVLYPSASVTPPTIVDGLTAKGWKVDQVPAYETVAAAVSDGQRAEIAAADAALFASGSSVDRFCELIGKEHVPDVVVCIGPTTAAAARKQGLRVDAVANPHTIDGLMAALQDLWSNR